VIYAVSLKAPRLGYERWNDHPRRCAGGFNPIGDAQRRLRTRQDAGVYDCRSGICRFARRPASNVGSLKAQRLRNERCNSCNCPCRAITSWNMPDTSLPQYDASTYIGYFDPKQPIADLLGNLPHWRQGGVTYFVTFRLADSIPQSALRLWLRERDDWLVRHPEPRDEQARREYYRLFIERFQKWLDAGHGACVLGQPPVREIVSDALMHFDMAR
jgi:hypothetical protein